MQIAIFRITIFLYTFFIFFGELSLQDDIFENVAPYRTVVSIINAMLNVLMITSLLSLKGAKYWRNNMFSRLIILWLFLIIINTFLTASSIERLLKDLNYVIFWPLNFIYVYCLVSKGVLNPNTIQKKYVKLFLAAIVSYILLYIRKLGVYGGLSTTSMNQSYYLVCFIPWILTIQNRRRAIILFLFSFVLILLSLKRTSLLAASGVLAYIIWYSLRNKNTLIKYILVALFSGIALFGVTYLDQHYLGSSLNERLGESDEGLDSRTVIWTSVLTKYTNSSLTEKIIGHGHDAVYHQCGLERSAHNEYLETLYDYGVIMLGLWIVIIISMIIEAFRSYKNEQLHLPFAASVIIYLAMSISSHLLLYPLYFIFLTSSWGFYIGMKKMN